jgi:hypothetical protein
MDGETNDLRIQHATGIRHHQRQRSTIMKKSNKIEIVIPTWEGRTGPSYWGDIDDSSHDHQSTSFWLSLRGIAPSDGYIHGECRAIGDIGLYVWFDMNGTVSINLRLLEAGSVSLYEGGS